MSTPNNVAVLNDDGSVKPCDVLDLYDLALLLNYERYAREPRFRGAKLTDFADGQQDLNVPHSVLQSTSWFDSKLRAKRIGFVFEKDVDVPDDEGQPDLPSNMLKTTSNPPRIRALRPHALDTIFWQARAHDSCFATIALLQYLFRLYAGAQPLRVRTDTGLEFISSTAPADHHSAQFTLHEPKSMTVLIVRVGRNQWQPYTSGDEESMPHCVMVFTPMAHGSDLETSNGGKPSHDGVALDLASMQFGDAGRGASGRSLFVLEPMGNFKARMLTVASRIDEPKLGWAYSKPERPELLWLKDVARRVKERYDQRATKHWCGHCGAPAGHLSCACGTAWYCDKAHQKSAWPFHKHYCSFRQRTRVT